MLYRKILKQALATSWRYKYLWFFGLFAALLGNGGEVEVLLRVLGGESGQGSVENFQRFYQTGIFSGHTLANIGVLSRTDTATMVIILGFGALVLVLLGFLIWLTVISQVAIVNNSAAIISRKKNDLRGGVEAGTNNFWPVLGLNFINKLLLLFIFIIASQFIILSTIVSSKWSLPGLGFIALFSILVILALLTSFIIKYAIAFVVVKGERFWGSIKNGWHLFINNWLVSIEMAVILFLINIVIGLAAVLAVSVLAIPSLFLAVVLAKAFSALGFYLIMFIFFLLLILIIAFTGAWLATFQISSWTGLFIELNGKGGVSKIIRLVEGWKK